MKFIRGIVEDRNVHVDGWHGSDDETTLIGDLLALCCLVEECKVCEVNTHGDDDEN